MGMLDRVTGSAHLVTSVAEARDIQLTDLQEQLRAEQETNLLLEESLADLELAAEDTGWRRLTFSVEHEFSRTGLRSLSRITRVMAVASPLIKRGLNLRVAYVWGQGVQIQARAGEEDEQDVNAVVQAFLDDPSNRAALTSGQAREELERALGTDGNVFLACFTNPRTGRVQVRSTSFDEIEQVITNPEDRDEPWYYLRQYETVVVEAGIAGTRTRKERRRELYPALGYRPTTRPRSIDGIPVNWDAPILHVSVNRLDGWQFGVGDAYAAVAWARAYDGFLTDWAKLVKALSRFAWRATGDRKSKAQAMAARARQAPSTNSTTGQPDDVAATAVMGPGQTLEAIPKSGATIDSESGRPLASMIAAGLGLPVTTLLADPGVTGARATAETLDKPTILEMGLRRQLWQDAHLRLLDHVIDQAVKAPSGPLRGNVGRDEQGAEVVRLAGDTERTVEVDWPDINEMDPVKLVAAIVDADSTGKLPPLTTVRLLLQALGVKNVDELLEQVTDDDGNFVDPKASAGDGAVQRFRRGQDPAEVLQ